MSKMIISTENVSREEIKELENYLENESWDWFKDKSDEEYAKGGLVMPIEKLKRLFDLGDKNRNVGLTLTDTEEKEFDDLVREYQKTKRYNFIH